MTKRRAAFLGLVVLLGLGWLYLFLYVPIDDAIEWLGVTNSYVVALLLGAFGAFTTLTSVSTYPAVFAMATGGVQPVALVAATALGLTLGDMLFIGAGRSARQALSDGGRERVERLLRWLRERPDHVTQWVLFFWVGFTPLANNLLTGPLSLTEFSPRKMVAPVFFGNLVFPILTVVLAVTGRDFLFA